MRNAHSRFGARYNRKYKRKGKVACERPKTLEIENDAGLMRCMFYSDCNPVRAGLARHPTEYRYSSCRFYAYGERNEFTDFLDVPAWYIALGRTATERQQRYRQLLDAYMRESGLLPDPTMCRGHFLGSELWKLRRREELSEALRRLDSG